jgi:hypothetical protein
MNEKLNHWLCISEDQFIEYLGYEALNEEISQKLDWLVKTITPSKTEVEALLEVIEDQERKLSNAVTSANDFLESINQNQYKGQTE